MNNLYQENIQLEPYNSFKTKAIAKYFAEPKTIAEVRKCLNDLQNLPILILGGGCNLFFTKDFDGLVIRPQLYGIRHIEDTSIDENQVLIEAMASENWDSFVQYCVDHNYANLENLSLIPGTVGASPVQNIGAYGAEVKDCIHSVTAIDIETNETIVFSNHECKFTYRDSIFKQSEKYLITSVRFLLNKRFEYIPKYTDLNRALENTEQPSIKDVRQAVIQIRRSKLPNESVLPNAGSFFKNPYIDQHQANRLKAILPDLPLYPISDGLFKTSAAFLIDRAGLKGKQIGQIGTYTRQALIIVNYGSSDGNDILAFMKFVQQTILDQFGIKLTPEVRIL